ncbi:hypothetical protein [Nocardia brasiliensis]|uniref:hypothetical protein n=1 Tax=Nocardia brasiliensis TaxID=37326 RepID=UPI002455C791|nr:hypothetical protein [Nocardia brasiliensis]
MHRLTARLGCLLLIRAQQNFPPPGPLVVRHLGGFEFAHLVRARTVVAQPSCLSVPVSSGHPAAWAAAALAALMAS